jgi:hypothetical protein
MAVAAPVILAGLPVQASSRPALGVSVTAGPGAPRAGHSHGYLVSIANPAPELAWFVHLSLSLPAGTTVAAVDGGAGGSCRIGRDGLRCGWGTVPGRSALGLSVTVSLGPGISAGAMLTASAVVEYDWGRVARATSVQTVAAPPPRPRPTPRPRRTPEPAVQHPASQHPASQHPAARDRRASGHAPAAASAPVTIAVSGVLRRRRGEAARPGAEAARSRTARGRPADRRPRAVRRRRGDPLRPTPLTITGGSYGFDAAGVPPVSVAGRAVPPGPASRPGHPRPPEPPAAPPAPPVPHSGAARTRAYDMVAA